jgi:hypothetical protein
MPMTEAISQFWNWFESRNQAFLNINNEGLSQRKKDALLDEMQEHLHKYCDYLYFEVGGKLNEENELIITAEGNSEYFKRLEDLIDNAPAIENWTFTAFIQPTDSSEIEFEDVELKLADLW